LFSEGSSDGEVKFWGGDWGFVFKKGKDDVVFRGLGSSSDVTDKLLDTACWFSSSNGGEDGISVFSRSLVSAGLVDEKEGTSLQKKSSTNNGSSCWYRILKPR